MKLKEIKRIFVDQIGWVESNGTDQITVFEVNGEMAQVVWFRCGKKEYNGKYVIHVEIY